VSQALYRRYRPETFSEVIGQEHVTEPLSQALRSGRVSHAYLFSGPRGCGKTTSARILARCLNCAQGPAAEPCGQCDSCGELSRAGSGSLDVVEIDAASHGGVDDTRELRERAVFAPARDRFKIFILDEAHMVSQQGLNAPLKIVEEPPPHVKFVFATTEPEKVLPTIRSRSHHYPFRLVPPGLMTDYMSTICASESITAEAGVLPLVVKAGGGSVRDTESVLDQLMAGSAEGHITYSGAAALLGYTPAAMLDQMVAALGSGDGAAMFDVVEQVIESGQEPRRFAEDLLERLRDLLIMAASGDQAQAALRALPPDQLVPLRAQASAIGLAGLSAAADSVSQGLAAMMGATSPRLQLELLAARTLMAIGRPVPAPMPSSAVELPGPAAQARPMRPAGQGQTAAPPAAPSAPLAPEPSQGPAKTAARRAQAEREPNQMPTQPPPTKTPSASAGPGPAGRQRPNFVDWVEPQDPATGSGSVGPSSPLSGDHGAGHPPRADAGPLAPTAPHRPAPSVAPGGSSLTVSQVNQSWDKLAATLKAINISAAALLVQDAFVAQAQGDTVELGFSNPGLAKLFTDRFTGPATEAFSQVLGRPLTVIAAGQDRPAAPKAAQPTTVPPVLGAAAAPQAAGPTLMPQIPELGPPAVRQPSPEPTGPAHLKAEPPPDPSGPASAAAAKPTLANVAAPARPGEPMVLAVPEPTAAPSEAEPVELIDDSGDPGLRGLTGVPLIQRMFDADIIDEIAPPDDGK